MGESYATSNSDSGPTRATVGIILGDDEPRPPGIDAIAGDAELVVVRRSEADRLASRCQDAEALFVWEFRHNVVRGAIADLPRLRWIQTASAGVDAVVSPEVVERRITVTNARGVLDDAIAEWVLGVLLLFVKDLRRTLDLQREHRWQHRESERLAGRRLLVIGAGSVGRAIARLARAAGMRVEGVARRRRDDDPDFDRVETAGALPDLLPGAEFVVVSAPLTPDTRGMVDEAAFAAMPPGVRFVNVGRGPIVDEAALLAALRSGHVAAAALDVFAHEPLPPDHPFWDLDQVVVSPHQAGDFEGWRAAFTDVFVDNFRRWRRGEALRNVVDVRAALAEMSAP